MIKYSCIIFILTYIIVLPINGITQNIGDIKMECIVEGCQKNAHARGCCSGHYSRFIARKGLTTKQGPSKIVNKGAFSYIELLDCRGKFKHYAIIDTDKVDVVNRYRWTDEGSYVMNKKYGKLHHFIAGCPINGLQIDHKNNNGLDNRIENLRVVTRSINMINRPLFKDNKFGCKGISIQKNGSYHVVININKKCHHLGSYKELSDAIKVRKDAERLYFTGLLTC